MIATRIAARIRIVPMGRLCHCRIRTTIEPRNRVIFASPAGAQAEAWMESMALAVPRAATKRWVGATTRPVAARSAAPAAAGQRGDRAGVGSKAQTHQAVA